jgi:hypothetical protein
MERTISMSLDTQRYTLPLVLMAILVGMGCAAWVMNHRKRRQFQESVEAQFKEFRRQAVGLMDQLDALRQRHKTLPSTDPDFTAPMAGATLALYNAVETDLNVLWERWLKVMELWDQAQKLVRGGPGLGVKHAEEARKLLDRGDIDDLLRQSRSCKERLDRLNEAHERAREVLETSRAEAQAIRQSVDRGTGMRHPADAPLRRIDNADRVFSQAEGMLTPDPIGALETLTAWRRSLEGAPERSPTRIDGRQQSVPAYSILDDLAAAADQFRNAAASLRLSNLIGLFVRFWLVVWGISFLIGLFQFLLPLFVFVMAIVVIIAGFWAIWQTVTFWFWYALWHGRR